MMTINGKPVTPATTKTPAAKPAQKHHPDCGVVGDVGDVGDLGTNAIDSPEGNAARAARKLAA